MYFLADELGVEQCRWYDGPIAARDGYVVDDLINGLLAADDDAIAEVQRIHGRATAAGQGLDDIAAAEIGARSRVRLDRHRSQPPLISSIPCAVTLTLMSLSSPGFSRERYT